MPKQHTIANVEDLRKRINRDYLIRLTFPKDHKRIVVGFTRFCEIVGNLHAEHYSRKALKSLNHAPKFKGQAGRLVVTFYLAHVLICHWEKRGTIPELTQFTKEF